MWEGMERKMCQCSLRGTKIARGAGEQSLEWAKYGSSSRAVWEAWKRKEREIWWAGLRIAVGVGGCETDWDEGRSLAGGASKDLARAWEDWTPASGWDLTGVWEAGKQDLLGKLTGNDTRMPFGGEDLLETGLKAWGLETGSGEEGGPTWSGGWWRSTGAHTNACLVGRECSVWGLLGSGVQGGGTGGTGRGRLQAGHADGKGSRVKLCKGPLCTSASSGIQCPGVLPFCYCQQTILMSLGLTLTNTRFVQKITCCHCVGYSIRVSITRLVKGAKWFTTDNDFCACCYNAALRHFSVVFQCFFFFFFSKETGYYTQCDTPSSKEMDVALEVL